MDVFAAVSEPARREILELLRGGERTAGDLVARVPRLSQPAVSRHLRILREVGLVRVRPDGPRRIYALEPAPLREVDAWIEHFRSFWADHLDALERHLASTHGATPSGATTRITDEES